MLPIILNKTSVPMYSLQSETFQWKENLDALYNLFKIETDSIFGVVKGTSHQSFSDFYLLFPNFMRISGKSKGIIDPAFTMTSMVESSMQYIASKFKLDSFSPAARYFETGQRNGNLLFGNASMEFLYQVVSPKF